jgi:hypothetical protein
MAWSAILLFAAALALLQWAGGRITWLPLQTVLVFALLRLAGRIVPWKRWAVERWPNRAAMFLLFVQHFVRIAEEESVRSFRAWRLAAPHVAKPGGFSSLGHVSAAVLARSIIRAERFYAGLRAQGIDG